jgi:crotonobetainyl-CoA:carnitine CoA-transferase CaiB-like acyl-CoA transferase
MTPVPYRASWRAAGPGAGRTLSHQPAARRNRELLVPELNREIARRPRKELLQRLAAAGIPCGEVLGLLEALTSERTTRTPVRSAPPQVGKDTGDVLRDMLGLSEEKIGQRKAGGVTG